MVAILSAVGSGHAGSADASVWAESRPRSLLCGQLAKRLVQRNGPAVNAVASSEQHGLPRNVPLAAGSCHGDSAAVWVANAAYAAADDPVVVATDAAVVAGAMLAAASLAVGTLATRLGAETATAVAAEDTSATAGRPRALSRMHSRPLAR